MQDLPETHSTSEVPAESGERLALAGFPVAGMLELWHGQTDDFALLFLDLDGTVVAANAAVTRILGYEPQELVGATLRHIFTPEDLAQEIDRHELEVAARLGRAEDDRWHVGKAGRSVWVSGVMAPLRDSAGRQIGFAKLFRDRTDLRTESLAMENRLRETQAAMGRKNDFLSILGHELRNPLHTLTGAFEVLRQRGGSERAEAVSGLVARQLAVLEKMLDDLQDATRVDAGTMKLELAPLNLQAAIHAVIALHEPQARARSQELACVVPNPEIVVMADSIRLEQILRNLLDNAIKYTPEGGRVSLTATVEGAMGVVRIEDDGMGLSASVLPRIFELFTREDRALDSATEGLGIGLALVKNLVELHHGAVQVQSAGPGKGSEFTIRLPLAQPHTEEPPLA